MDFLGGFWTYLFNIHVLNSLSCWYSYFANLNQQDYYFLLMVAYQNYLVPSAVAMQVDFSAKTCIIFMVKIMVIA